MSGDQTAAALARLQIKDEKLKRNLHKLHLSHQHSFLPWKHFSAAHLTQVASLPSLSERRSLVSSILGLEAKFPLGECSRHDGAATPEQRREHEQTEQQIEQDPNVTRREITIDLALAVLGFCWSSQLSALKTSTFFSILYTTHEACAERPGPSPPLAEVVEMFESLLLRHSVERPPFSICCFSAPDVSLLSRWVGETYMRQLKLYQYAFGTRNELDIRATNCVAEVVDLSIVGVPPAPAPQPPAAAAAVAAQPDLASAASGAGAGSAGAPPAAAAAGGAPSSGAAAAPAIASPPATAAGATATAASAATVDWWNLDHALNYFPHTSAHSLPGVAPLDPDARLRALPATTSSGALAEQAEAEEDEYRDSPSAAEFLEAASRAAEAAAANIAAGGSADGAPAPLLASPEDQALFDAAMARELGALYRDFGSQLRAQQDAFARRIAEVEGVAGGGSMSNRGSMGGLGDKGRPNKSRGKA